MTDAGEVRAVGLADLEPRRKPTQARSRQRVEAILDAFAELLVERGFDSLTTHMVAERAGVPVGTLYQFYPNKFSLVAALSRRHRDHFEKVFAEALSGPLPEMDSFEAMFDALTARVIDVLFGNQAIVIAWAVIQTVPELRSLDEEIRGDFQGTIVRLLEPAVPEVDAEQLDLIAMILYRMCYELLFTATQQEGPRRQAVLGELKRVVLAYVRSYMK